MEQNPFRPNFLYSLSFDTRLASVTFLKALALRIGFKLFCRDSIRGDTIRLRCHRGARNRGRTKTTKPDCAFALTLRRHDTKFVVMEQSTLEHNHPLLPNGHERLPDDVE
jgi:hypothetical protein